jgi:hypothetical protein
MSWSVERFEVDPPCEEGGPHVNMRLSGPGGARIVIIDFNPKRTQAYGDDKPIVVYPSDRVIPDHPYANMLTVFQDLKKGTFALIAGATTWPLCEDDFRRIRSALLGEDLPPVLSNDEARIRQEAREAAYLKER